VIGSLSSRVPEDHRQYFEEQEGGTVKCLPCTWQVQKQVLGRKCSSCWTKMLEKIDLHLGLKVRKSKKQDHGTQLVSWEKQQARYDTAMCTACSLVQSVWASPLRPFGTLSAIASSSNAALASGYPWPTKH